MGRLIYLLVLTAYKLGFVQKSECEVVGHQHISNDGSDSSYEVCYRCKAPTHREIYGGDKVLRCKFLGHVHHEYREKKVWYIGGNAWCRACHKRTQLHHPSLEYEHLYQKNTGGS